MANIISRLSAVARADTAFTPAPLPAVLLVGRGVFLERVSAILREGGFTDEWARSESAARVMLESGEIGLIVLDGGLTAPTDFSVCSRLARSAGRPVIMMTTGDDECDRILALELGADDCLSATWSSAELLARTRAALRRGQRAEPDPHSGSGPTTRFGEWSLAHGMRQVFCPDGRRVRLSSLDMTFLECLARNEGRLTTSAEIIDASALSGRRLTENHLRVQMSRLRVKLGRDTCGRSAILSVRTRGYALVQDRPATLPEVSHPLSTAPLRPSAAAIRRPVGQMVSARGA